MGQNTSLHAEYETLLYTLSKVNGVKVKRDKITVLFCIIQKYCYWLPEKGTSEL